jgi:4-hydroxy-3-methylbut-2-en-1-yl diphosphate reductase
MAPGIHIIRAEVSGFCSGVKRALQLAEDSGGDNSSGPVYTYGDLVHNDQVMKHLSEQGISSISSLHNIESGTVIIRAHGAAVETLNVLTRKGIRIVDATCPKVKRSHRIIEKYTARGFHIIIAGEPDHSEVRGLVSRAQNFDVVESVAMVGELSCTSPILLIAQTTFSPTVYKAICDAARKRYPQVEISRTICPAMEQRHEAVERLAARVDAILIIGGNKSANTKRLFEKALASGKPAWHIEHAGDIPEDIYSYNRIGIAAGASTPESVVRQVEMILEGEKSDR